MRPPLAIIPNEIISDGMGRAFRSCVPETKIPKEPMMATALPTATEIARSKAAVKGMLRDLGYVLWLGRKLAAEVRAERQPARPEMAEFCAVEMAACAA